MARKRHLDLEDSPPKGPTKESKAARFNAHVLKWLQAAVAKDPEINLAEQFPFEYPQRLMDMRNSGDPSPKVVVKAVRNMEDYTEYTTLQYLDSHKSSIPAPKPLGVVLMSRISFIFMSHARSTPLAEVWNTLDSSQKASLSNQINTILADLRTIPYTEGSPLGGVAGEGCKDLRRHVRMSETPITSPEDFGTFLFSSPHRGGDVFVKFLRQLSSSFTNGSGQRIVFTHGDIRPDNLMVMLADNKYIIPESLIGSIVGFIQTIMNLSGARTA
ncbi:hypothetical protein N7519_011054 [Penicillium mononematosum]|uniref:uncharacterized protein n=1 Tax=Penicillium mononematosum TaxID=268346 RepID=UPI0025492856|nr:uncharacterized protein N7519_011054 [Penicillium mononematosum]KAJ6180593.1 hypothetical protein N7519_011054 [Penicillium mononematosum]